MEQEQHQPRLQETPVQTVFGIEELMATIAWRVSDGILPFSRAALNSVLVTMTPLEIRRIVKGNKRDAVFAFFARCYNQIVNLKLVSRAFAKAEWMPTVATVGRFVFDVFHYIGVGQTNHVVDASLDTWLACFDDHQVNHALGRFILERGRFFLHGPRVTPVNLLATGDVPAIAAEYPQLEDALTESFYNGFIPAAVRLAHELRQTQGTEKVNVPFVLYYQDPATHAIEMEYLDNVILPTKDKKLNYYRPALRRVDGTYAFDRKEYAGCRWQLGILRHHTKPDATALEFRRYSRRTVTSYANKMTDIAKRYHQRVSQLRTLVQRRRKEYGWVRNERTSAEVIIQDEEHEGEKPSV